MAQVEQAELAVLKQNAEPGVVLQVCAKVCKDMQLLARLSQLCKPTRQVISDPNFLQEQCEEMALTYPWVDYARQRNLLDKPSLASIFKWVSFQHYYANDDASEDSVAGDEYEEGLESESDFDAESGDESEELSVIGTTTGASTRVPDGGFFRKAIPKCVDEETSQNKSWTSPAKPTPSS
ncbi:smyd2a, partial [Symbiodinium natans]